MFTEIKKLVYIYIYIMFKKVKPSKYILHFSIHKNQTYYLHLIFEFQLDSNLFVIIQMLYTYNSPQVCYLVL